MRSRSRAIAGEEDRDEGSDEDRAAAPDEAGFSGMLRDVNIVRT
jgi:hypothetical protein